VEEREEKAPTGSRERRLRQPKINNNYLKDVGLGGKDFTRRKEICQKPPKNAMIVLLRQKARHER